MSDMSQRERDTYKYQVRELSRDQSIRSSFVKVRNFFFNRKLPKVLKED